MHEFSSTSEQEQPQRFTPAQLQELVDENLAGTAMGEMLTNSKLSVAPDGYIEAQVCDNLRTAFRVAERMAPAEETKERFKKMLEALGEEVPAQEQERTFTDRVRDALLQAAPEHGDLITGRDVVVTAYCAEHGISKDAITIDQLLEIRALPEWQDPFGAAQA